MTSTAPPAGVGRYGPSGWHTYGAIIGTNTITYTFDGRPWATITNSNVTTKKDWVAHYIKG